MNQSFTAGRSMRSPARAVALLASAFLAGSACTAASSSNASGFTGSGASNGSEGTGAASSSASSAGGPGGGGGVNFTAGSGGGTMVPLADVDVVITADNAYSFGYGDIAGISNFTQGTRAQSAGQIFNCG